MGRDISRAKSAPRQRPRQPSFASTERSTEEADRGGEGEAARAAAAAAFAAPAAFAADAAENTGERKAEAACMRVCVVGLVGVSRRKVDDVRGSATAKEQKTMVLKERLFSLYLSLLLLTLTTSKGLTTTTETNDAPAAARIRALRGWRTVVAVEREEESSSVVL